MNRTKNRRSEEEGREFDRKRRSDEEDEEDR